MRDVRGGHVACARAEPIDDLSFAQWPQGKGGRTIFGLYPRYPANGCITLVEKRQDLVVDAVDFTSQQIECRDDRGDAGGQPVAIQGRIENELHSGLAALVPRAGASA